MTLNKRRFTAIVGPRHSGKSVLARQQVDEILQHLGEDTQVRVYVMGASSVSPVWPAEWRQNMDTYVHNLNPDLVKIVVFDDQQYLPESFHQFVEHAKRDNVYVVTIYQLFKQFTPETRAKMDTLLMTRGSDSEVTAVAHDYRMSNAVHQHFLNLVKDYHMTQHAVRVRRGEECSEVAIDIYHVWSGSPAPSTHSMTSFD